MLKNTQQQIILSHLKRGSLNSYYATYDLRIKQAPTRVSELKEMGYKIVSTGNKDRSVDWHLVGSPVVKQTESPILRHFAQVDKMTFTEHGGDKESCPRCNPQPRQMEVFV